MLIEPYQPEIKQGLIQIPESIRRANQMLEDRAVVVAVGPAAWQDESEPRAVPGDKVIVARYTGYMVVGTADGKQYRTVNDRDIFMGIIEEKANG